MSEATKAALDAALSAHIADECDGGTVTGYVVQAQYQDIDMIDDNLTGYLKIVAEGQGFTTTLGLARHLMVRLDAAAATDD